MIIKKTILITILTLLSFVGFCQYTTTHKYSSPTTLEDAGGGLRASLINRIFVDTLTANGNQISHYAGGMILVGNSLYVRDSSATKWLLVNSGSSAPSWLLNGNTGTDGNAFIGTTDHKAWYGQANGIAQLKISAEDIRVGDAKGLANGTRMIIDDGNQTIAFNNLKSAPIDTTTYKPIVIDSYGTLKQTSWLNGGGGSDSLSIKNNGNAFGVPMVVGTKDNYDVSFIRNNINAGKLGATTSSFGLYSLSNNTGANNTALGVEALRYNTSGTGNTSVGFESLISNTTGVNNTGVGMYTLPLSTTTSNNTAVGAFSQFYTQSGYGNTSTGYRAMTSNNSGYENTAMGVSALANNVSGYGNTAQGVRALELNNGVYNTAVGWFSGAQVSSGTRNTSVGGGSLSADSLGSNNTAIGFLSQDWMQGDYNVSVGSYSVQESLRGNRNTVVGSNAIHLNSTPELMTVFGYECMAGHPSKTDSRTDSTIAIGAQIGYDGFYPSVSYNKSIIIGNFSGSNKQTGDSTLRNVTMIGNSLSTNLDSVAIFGTQSQNVLLGNGGTNNHVGIGTTTPDSTLTVVGGFKLQNGTQSNGYVLTSDAVGGASWQPSGGGSQNLNSVLGVGNDAGAQNILNVGYLESAYGVQAPSGGIGDINATGNKTRLKIDDNNNTVYVTNVSTTASFGINRESTTANLDVLGTLKFATGYQGAGKLLQSDADGNADWVTLTIPDTLVTTAGLGINITTPSAYNRIISVDTSSASILSRQRAANTYTLKSDSLKTTAGLGVTITTPSAYNRTFAVDTSNLSILSRQRAAATYQPIGTYGTVSSVATGLGLSGGTITTTGTLSVDTSNSSILSRQRAANTYQPIGTYLTINDTTKINAGINIKVTNAGKNFTIDADTSTSATKLATQGFVSRGYQPIGSYLTTSDTTKINAGLGMRVGNTGKNYTISLDTTSATVLSQQRAANTYTLLSDTSLFARKQMQSYSIRVNNTNASANATYDNYHNNASATYVDSITWTGTTAPSGSTAHTYRWNQVGNLVTLNITLTYGSAGSSLTSVVMKLPSDCPTPAKPTGLTSASNMIYPATGYLQATATGVASATGRAYLRNNSVNNNFEAVLTAASANYQYVIYTVQYFTN